MGFARPEFFLKFIEDNSRAVLQWVWVNPRNASTKSADVKCGIAKAIPWKTRWSGSGIHDPRKPAVIRRWIQQIQKWFWNSHRPGGVENKLGTFWRSGKQIGSFLTLSRLYSTTIGCTNITLDSTLKEALKIKQLMSGRLKCLLLVVLYIYFLIEPEYWKMDFQSHH